MEENNQTTHDILDQVQASVPDSIHPFLDYLLEHGKMIIAGVAAIIVIAAGVAGYQHMQHRSQLKAQSELGTILIKYSGTKKAQELADFLKTAPAEMKPAVELALAKAWMDASKFTQAGSVWAEIAKSDEAMAPVASIGQAKCLVLSDKPEEAVKVLQALKNKVGENFANTIDRLLASAAEKAGNNQLAIQAYQGLLNNNPAQKLYLESKIDELKAKL
ncbi:tetratricopeptide repeat protein [Desulfovibrio sp. UCD-KL4C]|uniref:tetratricopeptide repeat protein n=1 Tax=Desulfovibrio sp. UCD-KL4C TaxID=2578120 RepID=UPI0025BE7C4F|nr:tetratricopeptide repeat protein [Desulfovibrio sp. UCD-KL4C]